jgi:ribose transport system permease protein
VTTYRPGYFNVPGALVTIVLLAVSFNGLNLLGAPYWLQPIINGIVIILAVITARAEGRRSLSRRCRDAQGRPDCWGVGSRGRRGDQALRG